MELTLYQTLEDRENPDKIEAEGPFICRSTGAWLGDGYYFWDTHIELGHWWGKTNYSVRGYVVCRAFAILDNSCWDLHGNGNHRLQFENVCKQMVDEGIAKPESLLVPNVIAFLKKKKFPFKAIRALGMGSISSNQTEDSIVYRIKFKENKYSYLDLHPPVQLCLIEKKALSIKEYLIVFPQNYVETGFI